MLATVQIPALNRDPFSEENLRDPYPLQNEMREAGPVVWLPRYDVFATARYAEISLILNDWKTFCSSAGIGLANFRKEKPWRPPSLVLEADPPEHTAARAILTRALAPAPLRGLREMFTREAQSHVERLLALGTFDAIKELAAGYPLKVFGDALGIAPDEREIILEYGNMSFNALGPRNAICLESMKNAESVSAWIMGRCQRNALSRDGLGAIIYQAVDQGEVSEQDAAMMVRSFLSAGIDTTVRAIGSGLYLFAQSPDQWQILRDDPSLARAAFEEILRLESPFQTAFRTTTKAVEVAGIAIPNDQKIMLSFAGGNRDPRKWDDPERFDIRRRTAGHLGFGAGIHGCLGQMLARLEVDILLTEMAKRISSIEVVETPEYLLNNTVRGFKKLVVRVSA